jgi:hypothetical protein
LETRLRNDYRAFTLRLNSYEFHEEDRSRSSGRGANFANDRSVDMARRWETIAQEDKLLLALREEN